MDTHICVHISIYVTFTQTTHDVPRTRIKRETELSSITVQEEQNKGSSSIPGKAKGRVLTVSLAKNPRPGAQWKSL